MQETVSINGLTLCHKHSEGWVRSTLPDVCKSPSYPVPYTNIAFSKDLADGTTTVFSHHGAMNGIKGSRFAVSIGDEPGVGGGVISGVNMHEATFLSWSPNVFMEGRAVTRLTDKMLMNKGNTVSMGGYFTGPVNDDDNKDTLEEICKAACECAKLGTLTQTCIRAKIEGWAKALGKNIFGELGYIKQAGKWVLNGGKSGGGAIPDFTDFDNESIIEFKGPKDRFRRGQNQKYDNVADDTGYSRENVHFRDCDCDGKGRTVAERKAAESPAPQSQPSSFWKYVGYGVGGAAIVGGIACAVLEPCGAIVAGAAVTVLEAGGAAAAGGAALKLAN